MTVLGGLQMAALVAVVLEVGLLDQLDRLDVGGGVGGVRVAEEEELELLGLQDRVPELLDRDS